MNSKKVIMSRLIKRGEMDRSFDLEFWKKVGAQGRFAAAWQMVKEWLMIRGKDGSQSRLQRSAQNIQRRKR
ncbi:MAG: hypothetical protein ACE5JB_09655 [bacterium]